MADVKNIITLGIGAGPGGLIWFMTSGLESAVAVEAVSTECPKIPYNVWLDVEDAEEIKADVALYDGIVFSAQRKT